MAEAGDWQGAAREAAERPGVDKRIESVIERLIEQGRGRRSHTPPPVYVEQLDQLEPGETNELECTLPMEFPEINQRAGPSGSYHPDPFARRAQIDSSDDDDKQPPRPVWPPPPTTLKYKNPFILD
jgi:hypothetical protein